MFFKSATETVQLSLEPSEIETIALNDRVLIEIGELIRAVQTVHIVASFMRDFGHANPEHAAMQSLGQRGIKAAERISSMLVLFQHDIDGKLYDLGEDDISEEALNYLNLVATTLEDK